MCGKTKYIILVLLLVVIPVYCGNIQSWFIYRPTFNEIKSSFDSQIVKTTPPLMADTCEQKLFLILKNAKDLLNKDSENLNLVIQKVDSLRGESKCPLYLKALANSYYARLLTLKYLQKSYIINQRTPILGPKPNNIEIWSKNIYEEEIFTAIQAAIKEPLILKMTPEASYRNLLTNGTSYSNLYELITKQSLETLNDASQLNAGIIYSSNMNTWLAPANQFISQQLSSNINPFIRLSLTIYQQLLRFKLADKQLSEFINTDLDRLQYVFSLNYSLSTDYYKALSDLYEKYKDEKESLLIAIPLIENYIFQLNAIYENKNTKSATELWNWATDLINKFPDVPGSCQLQNLIYQLENGACNISTREVVSSRMAPEITLMMKNCEVVRVSLQNKQGNTLETKEIEGTNSIEWQRKVISFKKLPFGEYKFEAEVIPVKLKKTPSIWPIANNIDSVYRSKIDFVVSDIKMIVAQLPNQQIQILAVDQISGKPLNRVKIESYGLNYRQNGSQFLKTIYTDKDGLAVLPAQEQYNRIAFKAINGKDQYLSEVVIYAGIGKSSQLKEREQMSFFTDRSIYRPGQVVYFKGLLYAQDSINSYAISDRILDVSLYNSQNKQLSTQQFLTDQFGAIAGKFNLPLEGLNGTYEIRSSFGRTYFQVASYKRPTFEVLIQKPSQEYTIGDSISITGAVESYSGVKLDYVPINYRISYQPFRWFAEPTYIQSGSGQTTGSGEFLFDFKANIPDNFLMKSGYYIITVSATTLSGETQQNEIIIPISTSSYLIDGSILQNQPAVFKFNEGNAYLWDLTKKGQIVINISNLSQQLVKASGKLMFYRLAKDTLAFPAIKEDTSKVLIKEIPFVGNKPMDLDLSDFNPGRYLLVAEVYDDAGKCSEWKQVLIISNPQSQNLPAVSTKWLYAAHDSCKIGESVNIRFGTSAKSAYVLYQVFSADQLLDSRRIIISDKVEDITFPYKKEYGDQISIVFTFVKENILLSENIIIYQRKEKPELFIRKESFRNNIHPGEEEIWRFSVVDSKGNPTLAQVLADMYDASLDAIYPNKWYYQFQRNALNFYFNWNYAPDALKKEFKAWGINLDCPLNESSSLNLFDIEKISFDRNIQYLTRAGKQMASNGFAESEPLPMVSDNKQELTGPFNKPSDSFSDKDIRSDLTETAFFYPKLLTDSTGNFNIRFIAPQSLTKWNVRLLATTTNMHVGYFATTAITTKELMIVPNLPRFVRQGDSICMSAMILNKSGKPQIGVVKLELFDINDEHILLRKEHPFNISAEENGNIEFCISVPNNLDFLGVRMIASSNFYQDGEQQAVPVLPSKTLVTKSMILNMPGNTQRTFIFEDYLKGQNKNVQNYRYTIEYTGNPTWYAVLALPALSPVKSRSASSAISSFYVNTLAKYIANSNPEIRKAVEVWSRKKSTTTTLLSQLDKNESLKQILLDETPWVLQAASETQTRMALELLFNENQIKALQEEAIDILTSLQNADGGISWFAGMPSSVYQTLYVLDAFSRLVNLNAFETPENIRMLEIQAIKYTDQEIIKSYNQILMQTGAKNWQPSQSDLYWAYIRGYYRDIPFYGEALSIHKAILGYYQKNHADLNLYQLALLSLTFRQYGFAKEADLINSDLKKWSTQSEVKGIFWANNRINNQYNSSIIQTHVLLMDALYRGGASMEEMNRMKLWLLDQKQTQIWESTPATVDAIYGILMTGGAWLKSNESPLIKVGSSILHSDTYLNYADTVFLAPAMNTVIGTVNIDQIASGPGYGAVYWQYFEPFNYIKQGGADLVVEKQLFKEINTQKGVMLEPIMKQPLKLGDYIVTRFIVTATKNFEFVNLKDQRAACFEPIQQLSGYQWDGKIGYYLETKDASTNYFFSNLPQGTYIFEYRLKVTAKGIFHDGISSIQCLYAPQFVGNTQGQNIIVK